MKAKILRTSYYTSKLSEGEIVEIIPGMETDAEGIWNAPAGKLVLCRKEDNTFTYASPLDMEIIEYDTVDWSSFRREVAKDVLPVLINFANSGFEEESVNLNYWTCRAIEWADALIEKLKEKEYGFKKI